MGDKRTAWKRQRGPRSLDGIRDAKRRFLHLGVADQLALVEFMTAYLARRTGRRPAIEREVAAQIEALDCLARVARYLNLATAPTAAAYRAVWEAAGASMDGSAVIRAFGCWEDAKTAHLNGRLAPTASQRALVRASIGRRRSYADYIAGVRIFLDSKPASETKSDYNSFTVEWNDRRPPGTAPLVTANTVTTQTALTWAEVKALARGQLTREEALERRPQGRPASRGDWGELVSLNGVATILEQGHVHARAITLRPDFPAHVRVHARRRIWWRADVKAYRDGRPSRTGTRPEILFANELRARLGYAKSTIGLYVRRYPHLLPPVDGRVAGAYYWLATNVDSWSAGRRSAGDRRATSHGDDE